LGTLQINVQGLFDVTNIFSFFFFLIFVKMADNLGPMAWLLLPENEQVQYLLKIALRAENPSGFRNFDEQIFSA
jgi:hypothetical protein